MYSDAFLTRLGFNETKIVPLRYAKQFILKCLFAIDLVVSDMSVVCESDHWFRIPAYFEQTVFPA